MRAGKRDDAMETVIAKTVAAFMNSGGGTLLIGVDDDGRLIGLGPDYATLKTPDADRFELWIRDLWGQRLGTNAAALPLLDFAEAPTPRRATRRQEGVPGDDPARPGAGVPARPRARARPSCGCASATRRGALRSPTPCSTWPHAGPNPCASLR